MPSDAWGWVGFTLVTVTGGCLLLLLLTHLAWWVIRDRTVVLLRNWREYRGFIRWREEHGIGTPFDPDPDSDPQCEDDNIREVLMAAVRKQTENQQQTPESLEEEAKDA